MWGDVPGLWDGNPVKLDCYDHYTTTDVINSLNNKKKEIFQKELEDLKNTNSKQIYIKSLLWVGNPIKLDCDDHYNYKGNKFIE